VVSTPAPYPAAPAVRRRTTTREERGAGREIAVSDGSNRPSAESPGAKRAGAELGERPLGAPAVDEELRRRQKADENDEDETDADTGDEPELLKWAERGWSGSRGSR